MRSRRVKLWLLPMVFAVLAAASAATSQGTIEGRVVDSEGTFISGAYLLFHVDHVGEIPQIARPDVTRESDASGRFEVQLEAGLYDACVMAMAFTPQCRKVLVTSGKSLQHDIKMKFDPLVLHDRR